MAGHAPRPRQPGLRTRALDPGLRQPRASWCWHRKTSASRQRPRHDLREGKGGDPSDKRRVTATSIPEILEVVNAPGVVAACDRLVGKNWAIVPFTHNTPFASGGYDQHWHKDDNGPYNMRRHRHHHAVQVEMLYYPQAVAHDMGPTAVVPYSQYWTFNHEENHDNFAGADHLDFGYQLNGMQRAPASGPDCSYSQADVVARRTRHDVHMREAIEKTGWPLVAPFEVAPLKAGSVVLYSHNLFHRANHRRDDWQHLEVPTALHVALLAVPDDRPGFRRT